jgi:hypothetical protein
LGLKLEATRTSTQEQRKVTSTAPAPASRRDWSMLFPN